MRTNTITGAAALTIIPTYAVNGPGHKAHSDKLLIAAIGCGGEGADDIRHDTIAPKNNDEIAFLYDVDDRKATPRIKEFPKAKQSADGGNMRITNLEPANQFVKKEYRKGWGEMKI